MPRLEPLHRQARLARRTQPRLAAAHRGERPNRQTDRDPHRPHRIRRRPRSRRRAGLGKDLNINFSFRHRKPLTMRQFIRHSVHAAGSTISVRGSAFSGAGGSAVPNSRRCHPANGSVTTFATKAVEPFNCSLSAVYNFSWTAGPLLAKPKLSKED